MRALFLVLIVLFSPTNACAEETWKDLLGQLDGLSKVEKRAAIINVRFMLDHDLNSRFENLIGRGNTNNEEVRNSLLRTSLAYAEMSKICNYIDWNELGGLYSRFFLISIDFLAGKTVAEEYDKQISENWEVLAEIITPLQEDSKYITASIKHRSFSVKLYNFMSQFIDEAYERERKEIFP